MSTWIKNQGQVLNLGDQEDKNYLIEIEKLRWWVVFHTIEDGTKQVTNELIFLPGIVLVDIGSRQFNVPLCCKKLFQVHPTRYGYWNTE